MLTCILSIFTCLTADKQSIDRERKEHPATKRKREFKEQAEVVGEKKKAKRSHKAPMNVAVSEVHVLCTLYSLK